MEESKNPPLMSALGPIPYIGVQTIQIWSKWEEWDWLRGRMGSREAEFCLDLLQKYES